MNSCMSCTQRAFPSIILTFLHLDLLHCQGRKFDQNAFNEEVFHLIEEPFTFERIPLPTWVIGQCAKTQLHSVLVFVSQYEHPRHVCTQLFICTLQWVIAVKINGVDHQNWDDCLLHNDRWLGLWGPEVTRALSSSDTAVCWVLHAAAQAGQGRQEIHQVLNQVVSEVQGSFCRLDAERPQEEAEQGELGSRQTVISALFPRLIKSQQVVTWPQHCAYHWVLDISLQLSYIWYFCSAVFYVWWYVIWEDTPIALCYSWYSIVCTGPWWKVLTWCLGHGFRLCVEFIFWLMHLTAVVLIILALEVVFCSDNLEFLVCPVGILLHAYSGHFVCMPLVEMPGADWWGSQREYFFHCRLFKSTFQYLQIRFSCYIKVHTVSL